MIATLDKQSDASWPVSRSTAHHPNQWANTSEHVVQNLSLRTWRFWRSQREENNTYLPLRPSSLQRRSQRLTRRMNTGAGRSPSGYIDQVVVSFTDHKTLRNSLALCLFWKLVYTTVLPLISPLGAYSFKEVGGWGLIRGGGLFEGGLINWWVLR